VKSIVGVVGMERDRHILHSERIVLRVDVSGVIDSGNIIIEGSDPMECLLPGPAIRGAMQSELL